MSTRLRSVAIVTVAALAAGYGLRSVWEDRSGRTATDNEEAATGPRAAGEHQDGVQATGDEAAREAQRNALLAELGKQAIERQREYYSQRQGHLEQEIETLEVALAQMRQGGGNEAEAPFEHVEQGMERMTQLIAERRKELEEVIASLDRTTASQ